MVLITILIFVIGFILIRFVIKEHIEKTEKEQLQNVFDECLLSLKNLSKHHKMIIFIDLFFSLLRNGNTNSIENFLKEIETNRGFQVEDELEKLINNPTFQELKSKINNLPLEYKEQMFTFLTKSDLLFQGGNDLREFFVFLYLIEIFTKSSTKHGEYRKPYEEIEIFTESSTKHDEYRKPYEDEDNFYSTTNTAYIPDWLPDYPVSRNPYYPL